MLSKSIRDRIKAGHFNGTYSLNRRQSRIGKGPSDECLFNLFLKTLM